MKTVLVSNEVNVDMAPDGILYGIELLKAKKQLSEDADGAFVIANEVTGGQLETPLAPE